MSFITRNGEEVLDNNFIIGRPAIEIIRNPYLNDFYIPPNIKMNPKEMTILMEMNPQLPISVVQAIQQAYPSLAVMRDIGLIYCSLKFNLG